MKIIEISGSRTLDIVFPESLISRLLVKWNSEYEIERGRSRTLILELSYFLSEVQFDFFFQIVGFLSCVGCISTVVTLALCILKIYRKLSDDVMELEMAFAERDTWERHKIIKTLTGTWLYGIAIMFPPLVGWGSFNFESGDTVCAPNWREDNPAGRIYSVLLVIFAFVIPLAVSVAFFVKMYQRSSYEPDVNATASRDLKKAKKAVIIILVGVIIFVVGWTPYYACAMMSVFGGPEMFDPATSFIPGILAKASAVFNPLICLLVSKR